MGTQVRLRCVAAHKVKESGVDYYDASLLAAAASEQPAPSAFVDKGAGKLGLSRLASPIFQRDREYVITIEEVPLAPEPAPEPAKTEPKAGAATEAKPAAEVKPAAETPKAETPPGPQTA